MNRPTIGVVGVGTVGRALVAAFEDQVETLLLDPALAESSSMDELVASSSVVFLCVPTPAGPGGAADLRAYHDVLASFGAAGGAAPTAPILCVRSAVPPQAIAETLEREPRLRVVVAPEFLRERSAIEDMLAMRTLVLGGAPEDCREVEQLFRDHSRITGPMRTSVPLDAVAAAFLKYQANCFLAAKVSLMNEFRDLFDATASNVSWEALQESFHLDHERFGTTHWHVPGPDGKRGWGGACLPKDVAAARAWGSADGVPTPLLDAVWERNRTDRSR